MYKGEKSTIIFNVCYEFKWFVNLYENGYKAKGSSIPV